MSGRTKGWIIAIAVLAVVCAATVVVWEVRHTESEKAHTLAVELKAKATALGMRTPPVSVLEDIYGTDGGALASSAGTELGRALLASAISRQGEVNGRPSYIDRQVLKWHYLVLSVYQPDKVAEFKKFLKDLKTDDVVPD